MCNSSFVFIVSTIYQGYSALDIASKLTKNDNFFIVDCTTEGYFSKSQTFFSNVNIIDLSFFAKKDFFYQCFYVSSVFKKVCMSIGVPIKNLYIYNDREPFVIYFANNVFKAGGYTILVEEGLSMYRAPVKRFSVQNIKDSLKSILFLSYNKMKLNFRFGFLESINEIFLSKPGEFQKRFSENHKKLTYYKQDFNNIELNHLFIEEFVRDDSCKFLEKDGGKFIFLTQPLSELNIISLNEEMKLLDKVCDMVRSKGYIFIIKTHPKENLHKYFDKDFFIINSPIPAEILFSLYPIDSTGSFFSSASYNLSEYKDLKVFLFYKMFKSLRLNLPVSSKIISIENEIDFSLD